MRRKNSRAESVYGYIRPDRGELRGREYELFRAEYCGLCQTLRERYGAAARFVVNYDLTFLAMVLSGDKPSLTSRRCPVHPMQKRPFANADPALEAAADYSVILTWWKLLDTLQDETGLKAAAALAGETAFRRAYRKAALRRPAFDTNVRERLAELSRLEGADEKSLDRAADCFASILAAAGEERVHLPCRETAVVNTTGAGDAATAAIVWAGLRGCSLLDTARVALAAGALTASCEETNSALLTEAYLKAIL